MSLESAPRQAASVGVGHLGAAEFCSSGRGLNPSFDPDKSRVRELFPLPAVVPRPRCPGQSVSSRRRSHEVRVKEEQMNSIIGCLNEMYAPQVKSSAVEWGASGAQKVSQHKIFKMLSRLKKHHETCTVREAAQELLHTSVDYSSDRPTSTVRSYDRDLVSLPQSGDQPVELLEVLDDVGREYVKDPLTAMMISEEEHGELIEKGDTVRPYMDVRLQREQDTYEQFILDLFKSGMLEFTCRPQDLVTPFFVHKKNNRLRFILDCRMVNKRFKRPPGMALAAGSTWSQVSVPPGDNLFIAQSDIKDYFYSLSLPLALRPYFCLPSIRFSLLQEWGVPVHLHPQGIQEGLVFPMLRVIPMGSSWAMWISQRVHQNISLIASGLDSSRVVVDHRAPPDLSGGDPIIIPYADNLNVAGTDQQAVQDTKDRIVKVLGGHGFRVHEELDASDCAQSLGFLIDGSNGLVAPVPEKLFKVQQAFRWLAGRPKVRGKEVERLLGHATHLMMLRRELLSIFRSLYDFVQGSYEKRSRLWPSAVREARWAGELLALCSVDLRSASTMEPNIDCLRCQPLRRCCVLV